MATIVLSAVGSLIGGPIGGGIGAIIGNQIDQLIFKPSGREGPRLKELAVTTASYGAAIPRHFGTMRAAGSIIWSTELIESSETAGGGKGQPSTKTFSYSISFAVALASRPLLSVGRVWADGNLLRGAAGDMKVAGQFRFYSGHGDQLPDPLLAAAEGADCPAFRGIAYCVFESLQLGEFGNRIPALTFEVVSGNGDVRLQEVLAPLDFPIAVERNLTNLAGFSDEGGTLGTTLSAIAQVFPMACDAAGNGLAMFEADPEDAPIATLPEAVIAIDSESFGAAAGRASHHNGGQRNVPAGIRYYDVGRDYQVGMQRAGGRPSAGREVIVEFPGALSASHARALAEQAAERQSWSQDRLSWRIADLDPSLRPGAIVLVPDRPGRWRIEAWEWREHGLELELLRQPNARRANAAGDPGRSLPPNDLPATPTQLLAFELPWDGQGASDSRQVFAAASSISDGWTGAMLYADAGSRLAPLQGSGSRRSIIGTTVSALPSGDPHLVDRSVQLEVNLLASDLVLASRLVEDLAQGANRALVGAEIIQFASAEPLGNGHWRLCGILRGRGGTEHLAKASHPTGAAFILLDDKPVRIDSGNLGQANALAAIGIADPTAVHATIAGHGATLRPLMPVHPWTKTASDGSIALSWTRRARGAWSWTGTVEPPLSEQTEQYEVGLGSPDQPSAAWNVNTTQLTISAASRSQLQALFPGAPLWVRQVGSFARSEPLFLANLS